MFVFISTNIILCWGVCAFICITYRYTIQYTSVKPRPVTRWCPTKLRGRNIRTLVKSRAYGQSKLRAVYVRKALVFHGSAVRLSWNLIGLIFNKRRVIFSSPFGFEKKLSPVCKDIQKFLNFCKAKFFGKKFRLIIGMDQPILILNLRHCSARSIFAIFRLRILLLAWAPFRKCSLVTGLVKPGVCR